MSALMVLMLIGTSDGEIVSVGSGSYSEVRPEPCKALPEEIYKVGSLTGATPTNQWWSSLVWEKYSQNLFPHPLAMLCHEGGLAVTYPGDAMVSNEHAIMGGGLSKQGDFVIGHSEVEEFPDARLAGHSAWFVTSEWNQGEAKLRTSFGHGSPFVFGEVVGGKATIQFSDKPQVWLGEGTAMVGVKVKGRAYGIFGSTGSKWVGEGNEWVNEGGKGYFSVALLPDSEEETWELFSKYAHCHVSDTKVSSKLVKGEVKTRYQVVTEAKEGSGSGTIFALYPHQWRYAQEKLLEREYRSVRGEMKMFAGDGFTTTVPSQGVLPMFPEEGIVDRERMVKELKKEAGKKNTKYGDTYWEGKHLGKLATLSGIAEVLGEEELRKRFVDELKERLENWFTASEGEVEPLFYYNKTWGTLIGSRPSYGSDDQLNDHHFHYGYFIRAAAEVARLDLAWAKKWRPMVELLIRDIASSNFKDPLFPTLRCFDLYAGHSWASGHAKFGDGNNQESSSESMNAWYGMMMWGELMGDEEMRDLAIFLFNTERTAVEEYWFDVHGTNFPEDFPNVALGMVWGGKGAFATWFSGEIDMIHGINWLPFTPASIYMGRHPEYVKRNFETIVSKRKGKRDFETDWGDLVVMFNALSDPGMAAGYIDANPDCKLEGGNTHAFMSHWSHTLDQLGRNAAGVTADYPFTNVFEKGGNKTYVVYNFGENGKEVSFSDGTKMRAEKGMTVRK